MQCRLESYLWTMCLDDVMLSWLLVLSRSFKHGVIFAGLLYGNSMAQAICLWPWYFSNVIGLQCCSFLAFFLCTSIAVIWSLSAPRVWYGSPHVLIPWSAAVRVCAISLLFVSVWFSDALLQKSRFVHLSCSDFLDWNTDRVSIWYGSPHALLQNPALLQKKCRFYGFCEAVVLCDFIEGGTAESVSRVTKDMHFARNCWERALETLQFRQHPDLYRLQ